MEENSLEPSAQKTVEEFDRDNQPAYQETIPQAWMAQHGASDFIADKWAKLQEAV